MNFLSEVEKLLDMPPAEKSQVMRELASHYQEIKDELIASGMSEEQAEKETEKRLGDPKDAALSLNPVHCSSSWKTALITGIPFVLTAIFFSAMHSTSLPNPLIKTLGLALVIAITVLTWAVSIKEYRGDRRPIWLATWLASAFLAMNSTIYSLGRAIAESFSVSELLIPSAIFLCSVLVFSGIAFYLCRGSRNSYVAIGIISLIQFALVASVFINRNARGGHAVESAIAIWIFLAAALWTTIALRLFSSHRYGSAASASLFLFSVSWMTYGLLWRANVYPESSQLLINGFRPDLIIPGIIAIMVARASSQRTKISIMVAAITIEFIMVASNSMINPYYIFESLIMLIMVLIPAFGLRKTTTENRAELA